MRHPISLFSLVLAELLWPLSASAELTGFENGSPKMAPRVIYGIPLEPPKTIVAVACGQELEQPCKHQPPAINERLSELAKKWPQLQVKDEVTLACTGLNAECEARQEEDAASANAIRENKLKTKEEMASLHGIVTGEAMDDVRDDAAVVSQSGWLRHIDTMKLLYTAQSHEKFHANAAGIDDASIKLFKDEQQKQLTLISIFEEMEEEIRKDPKDKISLEILAFYQIEARKSEKNLGLLACEADKMSVKNKEAEAKLVALSGSENPASLSGISGTLKYPRQINADSTISGMPETEQRALRMIAIQGEILEPVDAYRDPAQENPKIELADLEEDSLFKRVHRKYRNLDERGKFQKSILDGAEVPVLP